MAVTSSCHDSRINKIASKIASLLDVASFSNCSNLKDAIIPASQGCNRFGGKNLMVVLFNAPATT
jgi:hypothetical protein